jgi:hypothetical protein
MTPAVKEYPLRGGWRVTSGVSVDYDALVAEARRNRRCAECGGELHHKLVPRSALCSDRCRYRFRDRRRYVENAEHERKRSRRYLRRES